MTETDSERRHRHARWAKRAAGFAAGGVIVAGLAWTGFTAAQAGTTAGEHHADERRGPPPFGLAPICPDIEAHRAAAIAFTEVKLHLSDAQQPVWAAFVEQSRAAVVPIGRFCASLGTDEPKTLPERAARAEAAAAAAAETMHILRPALDKLYAGLSAEQRELLDGIAMHMPFPPPPMRRRP